MWGSKEKIKELEQKLNALSQKFILQSSRMDEVVQCVASMRGMINRKLYSGKMKEDVPSWLESNLGFVGITKDKKDEMLDI